MNCPGLIAAGSTLTTTDSSDEGGRVVNELPGLEPLRAASSAMRMVNGGYGPHPLIDHLAAWRVAVKELATEERGSLAKGASTKSSTRRWLRRIARKADPRVMPRGALSHSLTSRDGRCGLGAVNEPAG